MMLPISAFIICQNEERVIEACVRSVSFCAEIVVVDSGSTDATLAILERLRAGGLPLRVLHEPWRGFGAQKQFALDQCTQDWCFSIDSDERVSPALARQFHRLLADPGVNGWQITRYDYLNGYGYVPPSSHERYHNRLFRRGTGRFNTTDLVHEGIEIDGVVKKAVPGGLLHFSPIVLHDQMLKENKYSTLKAQMKQDRGLPPRPWKMLVSPPLFFLRWYLRHGMWRCGWPGFIHCAKGAIYSFLTEAKRYENAAMRRVPPVEPADVSRY
ncbi:Glycosyltransferase involved in cell wall bisynthesis [Paracoccus solventivorans]|uniref:Glycosyltransferase involved in cell wall bisynthesis n=1 Tax=Paracoccus solventivorans TaxID=53463 RepID=A0A1M7GLV6_9RHOB|nr:glycosyltransferase family 2 protein [Paracoccus solventivorans]SHM16897.1 Glycosyltransferase involved in cell wall bisynthesis [Paracoccus solventivorans]